MHSPWSPMREYGRLVAVLDKRLKRLEKRLSAHMQCHHGCSGCCMSLSLFPVEWDAIRKELFTRGITPPFRTGRACGFLDDSNGCAIYPFRPIICRTHGLPLYRLDDDFEPVVDTCELNFGDYREGSLSFRPSDLIDMERVNRKLALINARHVKKTGYKGPHRRDMSALTLQYL